ncbi:ribonuclease E, partial [Francisella tularensis subsp. holarctica]
EIRLPSGGSIVIDTTEALVAIDVNSSRANKAEDVETTAFKTNLEAAEEVARQLRIRDLGGLVIVDFIDMSFYPNRKQVEEKLMEALQQDRARIQMSRISKLGLVEISRQRLSSSINESVMQKCPRCEGHGFIKTTQATALTILRKIRAEAIKEDTNEIRVQVPVDIAAYILNEKRDSIVEIERISQVKVMIIPNFNMESPKFQMQRIWGTSYKSNRTSSELIEDVYNIEIPKAGKKKIAAVDLNQAIENQAASNTQEQKPQTDAQVDIVTQNDKKQDDVTQQAKKKGFFARLFSGIFATDSKAAQQANNSAQKQQNKEQNFQRQQQHNKAQKDNNQRNERNNSNNKNERNKNKSNNDKFDKKSNNRNSRSNNLNLNNAEEVIDITQLKYQNQTAIAKTDNIKKVISKNPDEFISVMVKDVLENYDSLKDNGATKIATQEKIKTNKYLKFDTVSVDTEIALLNEVAKSNQTVGVEQITAETEESLSIIDKVDDITIPEVVVEQEKPAKVVKETNQTSEAKPKKEKQTTTKNNKKEKPAEKEMKQNQAKPEYINYSPAIDFESQALI